MLDLGAPTGSNSVGARPLVGCLAGGDTDRQPAVTDRDVTRCADDSQEQRKYRGGRRPADLQVAHRRVLQQVSLRRRGSEGSESLGGLRLRAQGLRPESRTSPRIVERRVKIRPLALSPKP